MLLGKSNMRFLNSTKDLDHGVYAPEGDQVNFVVKVVS